MRFGLLAALILIIVVSCIDNKDYQLTAVEVHPTMAIPLASGTLTILDVLKKTDSAYVKVDSADLVYLDYTKLLVSTDFRSLIVIPDKTVNQSLPVPAGVIPAHGSDTQSSSVVEQIDFGLTPAKLTNIDFKSGTISFSAVLSPANANFLYEIVLSSTDLISKSTGQTFSVQAPPSGTVDMSDYKVILNNNKFNLKLRLVIKAKGSAVTVAPNSTVSVTFGMAGMDFHSVKGFLGDQIIHPESSTLFIGAFGDGLKSANASFAQPKLWFDVINDYGAPCKLDFFIFRAQKDGGSLDGQLNPANPVPINYPVVLGNSATTSISVPNAKQLMDFAPTEIVYQLNAHVNENLSSGSNFLTDSSRLQVRLNVQVPLLGHASGIVMRDTAKLDLGDLNSSQIRLASLKVDVTNELPLDASLQLYLTDENYVVLDSIFDGSQTSLIKASVVTPSGDLDTKGSYDDLLSLDVDRLSKIFQSKYVIIKATLNSSKDNLGNSSVDVKFKSKYSINIKMGLLAEVNFNIKQ